MELNVGEKECIYTSAIQRINGASLKEHWAAQRNQLYSSIRCTNSSISDFQHDTGLKYEMEFFLS